MSRTSTTGGVRFAGYASVFDRIDRGGDVVRRGAFRRSLAEGGDIPLLWQHRAGQRVGTIERLEEDERGLQVIARLNDDAFGQLLSRELAERRLSGLSFGYRVNKAVQGPAGRELNDVDLLEVSLVRRPMQPLAQVHRVAR